MSISRKELTDSITNPKGGKTSIDQSGEQKYNVKGESDIDKKKKFNDVESCAVCLKTYGGMVYKVKAQRGGQFYNPLKNGETRDYSLEGKDRVTNDLKFKFKAVSKNAFENYVKFLQTGYDSFLIAAERA